MAGLDPRLSSFPVRNHKLLAFLRIKPSLAGFWGGSRGVLRGLLVIIADLIFVVDLERAQVGLPLDVLVGLDVFQLCVVIHVEELRAFTAYILLLLYQLRSRVDRFCRCRRPREGFEIFEINRVEVLCFFVLALKPVA